MSEPDHIFLRPIPNLMRKDAWPAAYPFFYIEPAKVRDLNDLTRHCTLCLTCSRPQTQLPGQCFCHTTVSWRSPGQAFGSQQEQGVSSSSVAEQCPRGLH